MFFLFSRENFVLRRASITAVVLLTTQSFGVTKYVATDIFGLTYKVPAHRVTVDVSPPGVIENTGGFGSNPRYAHEAHDFVQAKGSLTCYNSVSGWASDGMGTASIADSATYMAITFDNSGSLGVDVPFSFAWNLSLLSTSTQPLSNQQYGNAIAGLILYDTFNGGGQNFIFDQQFIATSGKGDPHRKHQVVTYSGFLSILPKSSTTLFITNYVSGRADSQPAPAPASAIVFGIAALLRRRRLRSS